MNVLEDKGRRAAGTYAAGSSSSPTSATPVATAPWRALKRSRDKAASELFAALYPRLAGWCRRLVDDDETAHEIASEAFTRLWARWTSVDEPRGFLYVTAANIVRDHWRKMERERKAMRHVTTEAASPGMLTRIEVVEPPYIAP